MAVNPNDSQLIALVWEIRFRRCFNSGRVVKLYFKAEAGCQTVDSPFIRALAPEKTTLIRQHQAHVAGPRTRQQTSKEVFRKAGFPF
jgi:hypothetical protein